MAINISSEVCVDEFKILFAVNDLGESLYISFIESNSGHDYYDLFRQGSMLAEIDGFENVPDDFEVGLYECNVGVYRSEGHKNYSFNMGNTTERATI